jgi:hypothetical protein
VTVGEDYNQSPAYVQAGLVVAINRPQATQWRAIVGLQDQGPIGPVNINVTFTADRASDDGPTGGDPPSLEEAYDVANTDFFRDLDPFFADRRKRFQAIDPAQVVSGQQPLSRFANVVLADTIWPGASDAQKNAFAAKLREYAEGGGNVVLTDAALLDLPRFVPKIAASKVKKQTVYVGQVSFQRCAAYDGTACDGTESTLKDPLNRRIEQPAARFNSGARRQTYESTPLGFAIQSPTGGDQSNAVNYDVEAKAFQDAGGRIAATSADASPRSTQALPDRATVGEFRLGKGTLRVAGALLPQPTNKFDHPLGLEPYAVTYTGYILFCNLIDADCVTTRSGVAVDDATAAGGSLGGGANQSPTACAATAGFRRTAIRARGRRALSFTLQRNLDAPAVVDVFRVSKGRRVLKGKRVALFRNRKGSFTWKGGRRLANGWYFARFRMRVGRTPDVRRHVFRVRRGRVIRRPSHYGKQFCGVFRSAKLRAPVFGGRNRVPLRIAYRLAQSATVRVTVRRGKKVVKRYKARRVAAERTIRLRVPRKATRRKGTYKVRVDARRASRTVRQTLTARRL